MIEASFEAVVPKAINAEFEAIIPREKAFDIVNKDIRIDTNGKYEVKADAGTAMTQVNITAEMPVIVDNQWRADVVWNADATFGFNSMKEIRIHEGVTTLGTRAFRYNESLQKIVLPESLQSIGSYAFGGMTKLTEINLPENITSISSYAFNGSPFEELIFPSKVTYPTYGICTACKELKRVILKGNLTAVAATAFSSCTILEYITFLNCAKVPRLENSNAFSSTPETMKIVVPDALYDQWIVATNWATYASRIVKASEFVEPTNN